ARDDYDVQPRRDSIDVQNPYAPEAFGFRDLNDYTVGTNATIFAPQGGLRISFDDLAKVMKMLLNRDKKILDEKSFDELIRPHWIFDAQNPNGNTCGGVMENYGLGMYRIDGAGKARLCKDFAIDLIGHSGEAFGLISGLYFVPNTGDGAVFMINGATLEDGEFGAGYLLEELIMNPVCRNIFHSCLTSASDLNTINA
ncbi:MAG: serine hydrolase, partial [Selenomonadaceae bacterium]|nr:serine hydrolase [Selenomonadaceae bacterium]